MKGIFSFLVENQAGVLSQISGLFARRGFNIDSLAVGETEHHDVSSMTIVSTGSERTIEFYAKSLCLSPKHLSKVVKQASGRTVHDWVDEYVITEAKALLRSTDMTVCQVADALGFASQPLFTKYFRRAAGLNPTDVRKNKSLNN